MSMGTVKTPPQLTARFGLKGQENYEYIQKQLVTWKVSEEDRLKFGKEVERLRKRGIPGQMQILEEAAHSINAALHWIH